MDEFCGRGGKNGSVDRVVKIKQSTLRHQSKSMGMIEGGGRERRERVVEKMQR